MKNLLLVLLLLSIGITCVSCKSSKENSDNSNMNISSSANEKSVSEKLDASEIIEQQSSPSYIFDEKTDNTKEGDFIKSVSVPKHYNKVVKGDKVYIYDSEGNSLIASNEKKYDKFSSLEKKDYAKILGSNFSDVKLLDFDKTSVTGKEAVRIKFESTKNDEKFLNLCYYLDCENNGIKIMIQAKTDKTLKELEETVGTITFS